MATATATATTTTAAAEGAGTYDALLVPDALMKRVMRAYREKMFREKEAAKAEPAKLKSIDRATGRLIGTMGVQAHAAIDRYGSLLGIEPGSGAPVAIMLAHGSPSGKAWLIVPGSEHETLFEPLDGRPGAGSLRHDWEPLQDGALVGRLRPAAGSAAAEPLPPPIPVRPQAASIATAFPTPTTTPTPKASDD